MGSAPTTAKVMGTNCLESESVRPICHTLYLDYFLGIIVSLILFADELCSPLNTVYDFVELGNIYTIIWIGWNVAT